MMLVLQHISYIHPDKELLFEHINLVVNHREKIALIGNNGSGKSTLLKIIAGQLLPAAGQVSTEEVPYFVPQHFGQYDGLTVSQVLGIEDKLSALQGILDGDVTEENLERLQDDWTIKERCGEALGQWKLTDLDLQQEMKTLSGGQKTRVFLAGIDIHQPGIVVMDEPSNHLDREGRRLLYEWIRSTSCTLVIVSHDRKLLNLLDTVCELSPQGITVYGGNYTFYEEQKKIAVRALQEDLKNKEKTLRKAKEKERETLERQQKLDARGQQKQQKAGVARIMMNTLRNKAEQSTSKAKSVHAEKIGDISRALQNLRAALPDTDKMKLGFEHSGLHRGKLLIRVSGVNYSYNGQLLWPEQLDFQLFSGDRIALKGDNGSGKTTLIRSLLGQLDPVEGTVDSAAVRSVYIDQDYSLLDHRLSVFEQVKQYQAGTLQEHELKTRLHRFLFDKGTWDKPCSALSGGERMRLALCCLTVFNQAPDLMILDEPTNNLDIRNTEILAAAIREYPGTLIVVSHDEDFLDQIGVQRTITLSACFD